MKNLLNETLLLKKARIKKLLLTMKLTCCLAFIVAFQAHALVYSQDSEFTISEAGMRIKDVLKELEDKSSYRFFYSENLFHLNKVVDIDVTKEKMEVILGYLFNNSTLTFKVFEDNLVVILPKYDISGQEIVIKGKVTDINGSPLPGVNIVEVGTTRGAVTDLDGNYTITVSTEDAVLSFSFVGYLTEEVKLSGQTTVDLMLVEDIMALDEVVVIGYGTAQKSDLTGALKQISGETFKDNAIQSSSLALQGRVAGVRVTNNGGKPGEGATIRIRGTTTRNNNEPLIVIDGQIVTSGLGFLNPGDIESMTVLKDASASAIYGSRAAAGVILITTKRGFEGKPIIEFSTFYTFDKRTNEIDMLSADEYVEINEEWFTNDGQTPALITPAVEGNTNWQDEIFRTGSQQNYYLSIRGGSKSHHYAVQTGYFHQEGILKNSALDRYSFRVNNDFWAHEKLKFTSSIDVNYAKGNQTSDGLVLEKALQYPPNIAVKDEEGDYVFSGYTLVHPLVELQLNRPVDDNLRALGNISAEYELIKGLKIKTFLGIEYGITSYTNFVPKATFPKDPAQVNEKPYATLDKGNDRAFVWNWDNTINYSKSFGDHSMEILLGHTAQSSDYEYYGLSAWNFLSNDDHLAVIDATLAPDEVSGRNNKSQWALASFIGRLNYDYQHKYLFTASFRRDRSSRIHPDYRNAFFPSFSAGWVLSEEPFFTVDLIDRLKVRAGWGQIGNERSGMDYPYQATVASGAETTRETWYWESAGTNAIFGGTIQTGATFNRVVNRALEWETTTTKNIGLDILMLNHSLSLTADYFIKDTDGIIAQPSITALFGLPASFQNESEIRNTGIELELTYKKQISDFYVEVSPNYTYIKNEIVTLSESEDAIDASIGKSRVGRPLSTFDIGYIADGIFQNQAEVDAHAYQEPGTAPGDIRYKDLNGDNVIDEDDRDWLGIGVAPHNYGISILVSYKNFDLNVLGVGQAGGQTEWNPGWAYHNINRPYEIVGGFARERWHGEGTSNKLPRLIGGDPNNNARFSTVYIESNNYFRIQNIQLGYTFSENILQKLKMSNLRVYIAGQNLFTFTNFNGYDPQTGYSGYPVPASAYFGLNVSF